jgi:hypothetical protein
MAQEDNALRPNMLEEGDRVYINPRLGGGAGVISGVAPSGTFYTVKGKGSFHGSDLYKTKPAKDTVRTYDRAQLHRALDAVMDAAKSSEGDYEVVWTDRNYKTQRKVFKHDPQESPDLPSRKAHVFAAKVEKDTTGKYSVRGRVDVRAL